ncbi:MAG: hypothetical protein J5I93_26775 [Pirellulaceae bacterium]|nr:hypothetical protein [Pirellulaceae bacterium]
MSENTGSLLFEEVFANVRKAAEANLKMQQEVFRQWTSMWPGMPTPQSVWVDKMRDFQKQWTHTVSDLAHRHKDAVDRQYQAALESLDAALRVSESSNPEEFRRRSEQLCRKSIDCMRELSEAQIKEFQDAVSKLTEVVTKVGT